MAKSAIQILKDDHAKAKRLFEEIERTDDDAKCEALWEELANDLRAHVQLEKEVFYPAILSKLGDAIPEDIIEDQEAEETEATELLEELDGDTLEGDAWMEKFLEFKDIALEHAVDVEEGELFPLVERAMEKRDLEELGARMERRHKELHQQVEAQAR